MTVFQKLVMIVGEGIGVFVERLLVEQLGFEQVAHPRGTSTIVVAVQTQVLLGLPLLVTAADSQQPTAKNITFFILPSRLRNA